MNSTATYPHANTLVNEEFAADPAGYIVKLCERLGISVSTLCTDAKVNRSAVERWKKTPPEYLRMLTRLQAAAKIYYEEEPAEPQVG